MRPSRKISISTRPCAEACRPGRGSCPGERGARPVLPPPAEPARPGSPTAAGLSAVIRAAAQGCGHGGLRRTVVVVDGWMAVNPAGHRAARLLTPSLSLLDPHAAQLNSSGRACATDVRRDEPALVMFPAHGHRPLGIR